VSKYLLLFFLPLSCFGAELNCLSPNKEFDVYLCNAHEISRLDKKLNSIYSVVIESENSDAESIKLDQLKWLKKRDSCLKLGDAHSCIAAMYKVREIQLRSLLPGNYKEITSTNTNANFTTQQLEYSHWSGRELNPTWKWPWEEKKKIQRHYFRKKAILINTSTGETWGFEYTRNRSTNDGYSWVKIPMQK